MRPVKFRIRPIANRFYFNVLVFGTKAEMWDWWIEYDKKFLGGKYDGALFGAMTIPYELVRGDERGSEIGTVIFSKERVGAGTIAHEMGHAAMWYDRLVNGNTNAEYGESIGEAEERMLYLLAELVAQTVSKMYKKKIL